MARMMVSLMQVLSLTWVTVRPARRRAAARSSPMLTPRLHCGAALRAAPGAGAAGHDFIIAGCDRCAAAPLVVPGTLRPESAYRLLAADANPRIPPATMALARGHQEPAALLAA